jgi:hypothetical protein
MKHTLVIIAAIASIIAISSCNNETLDNIENDAIVKSSKQIDWPKIVFGTKSHPCGDDADDEECYCTGDKGICLIIEPSVVQSEPDSLETGHGYGKWNVQDNGQKMDIKILDNYELDQGSSFYVEENIQLSSDVARALGYNSVTIESGQYNVDYTDLIHGEVVVDVITQ